ncbi:MAG: efflux RND transporter periplasmic adaptor subunit [Thermotaleaceae bacterium]
MKALEEGANIRRSKIIGKTTVVFLTVMLLLTFFSRTINNFTLPKGTYENPSNGALIKEASGIGNVQARIIHDLYVRSSMKVTGVMVEVGDLVKEGQTILTLDTTDIENQLKDERDKLAQRKLNLEKLVEANSPSNLLNQNKAVQTAQQSLDRAQRNYENSKTLHEIGGVSAAELADAKANLENAKIDYAIAENNRDKAMKDNQRDVESIKLDIDIAERKIAELTKELNMSTVTAPSDGIVTDLYYSAGMTANTSQPLYKIADTSGGFQFVATVNVSASEFLGTGDAAEISISSLSGRTIQGKVTQVRDNQQQIGIKKDVIIDIPTDGLVGGEVGTANIRKNVGSHKVLVSNSTLGQDASGYFVYVLKDSKGPLGNEFYVEKVTVSIGDSDNLKTAILSGISANDKVVSNSDKPLSDGSRVILAN